MLFNSAWRFPRSATWHWVPVVLAGLLVVSVLSGCVSITAIVNDKQASDLMPTEAAMKIFDKHGYGAWVRKPMLMKDMFCGNKLMDIEFSEITGAVYLYTTLKQELTFSAPAAESDKGKLFCTRYVIFKLDSPDKANDLFRAANALGANIPRLSVFSVPLMK